MVGEVVCGFDLRIDSGEIEIELTDMFGLERGGLEFNHHIALEAGMIEQQVDEKFVTANVQPELAANESKARAQLQ